MRRASSLGGRSIDKLGLEPSEVVYVCRGQFDIVGAKAAGLEVIWVNRAGEPLEDHGYSPTGRYGTSSKWRSS